MRLVITHNCHAEFSIPRGGIRKERTILSC